MSSMRARLHRIETVDVAGLLGGALNTLLRVAEGDEEDGARQAEWWELALGRPVDELAARVDGLRASASYRTAVLAFAAAEGWRGRGLQHLHRAIAEGSERGFRGWRWTVRAYRVAVERFVEEQALHARTAAALPRLEAVAARANLRRNPMHAAHFAALRERFAAEDRRGVERHHAADRARDVLSDVAQRERDRAALLQRRDALRKRARAAGISDASSASGTTLPSQVRALERALDGHEAAAAREHADGAAWALAAGLKEAFAAHSDEAFAGYEGEVPLLLRLASALPAPSPATVREPGATDEEE